MRSKGGFGSFFVSPRVAAVSSAASCSSRETHASVRTRSSGRGRPSLVSFVSFVVSSLDTSPAFVAAFEREANPRKVLRGPPRPGSRSRALGVVQGEEDVAAVHETSARVSSPCGFLGGREEGTRRGQIGRRWANPGGDARWPGRRSRERRAGWSVGGRTSRIVASSRGALVPPRRARRDAPSLKGRARIWQRGQKKRRMTSSDGPSGGV